MSEVINELICPNCKKTIQEIQVRRPYLKMKKRKGAASFHRVSGSYKTVIKND
jgi:hypothetical protein